MTLRELMLLLGALPGSALDREVRICAAPDGEPDRDYKVYQVGMDYPNHPLAQQKIVIIRGSSHDS